jgi:hypothetical protein
MDFPLPGADVKIARMASPRQLFRVDLVWVRAVRGAASVPALARVHRRAELVGKPDIAWSGIASNGADSCSVPGLRSHPIHLLCPSFQSRQRCRRKSGDFGRRSVASIQPCDVVGRDPQELIVAGYSLG